MTGGGTNALTQTQLENYLINFYSAGRMACVCWRRLAALQRYLRAGRGTSLGYLDDRNGDTLRQTATAP